MLLALAIPALALALAPEALDALRHGQPMVEAAPSPAPSGAVLATLRPEPVVGPEAPRREGWPRNAPGARPGQVRARRPTPAASGWG